MKIAHKIFIDWLKENNYYDRFMFNISYLNTFANIVDYLNHNDNYYDNTPYKWYMWGFTWVFSKEGHNYWMEAYDKWVAYCSNNKEKFDKDKDTNLVSFKEFLTTQSKDVLENTLLEVLYFTDNSKLTIKDTFLYKQFLGEKIKKN